MKFKFICKFCILIMFLLDFLEFIWKIIMDFFVILLNYFEIVVICIYIRNLISVFIFLSFLFNFKVFYKFIFFSMFFF